MLLIPETFDAYITEMQDALSDGRVDRAAECARQLSPTRAARVLVEAPRQTTIDCLASLGPQRAGQIIGQFPPPFAADVLGRMDQPQAAEYFRAIPPDNAADVLAVLEPDLAEAVTVGLDNQAVEQLRELGRFPPDSAGGVMHPSFVAIRGEQSVGRTLRALLSSPNRGERSAYVYVVDDHGRLIGVLSQKELMRLNPDRLVHDVMTPNVVAVTTTDSAIVAARLIRNRRLITLPVIDEDQRPVGVISFDDAMDILAENVAEQFAGLGATQVDESFFTPPLGAVKMRLPWMAANVFLNLGAVAVITGFEDTIAQVAILAAFLPMITDMGGNVGIQSLSVSIRSIALGEVRLRDFWKATRKEITIGLINGLALGVLFAIVAAVWQQLPFVETEPSPLIGILAGVALGTNVLVAGVVGGIMPFAIKRLGKDPAMITGPVLTTITDITGVSIYLGLCTLFLANILGG